MCAVISRVKEVLSPRLLCCHNTPRLNYCHNTSPALMNATAAFLYNLLFGQ